MKLFLRCLCAGWVGPCVAVLMACSSKPTPTQLTPESLPSGEASTLEQFEAIRDQNWIVDPGLSENVRKSLVAVVTRDFGSVASLSRCLGIAISKHTLVTAAHCLSESQLKAGKTTVNATEGAIFVDQVTYAITSDGEAPRPVVRLAKEIQDWRLMEPSTFKGYDDYVVLSVEGEGFSHWIQPRQRVDVRGNWMPIRDLESLILVTHAIDPVNGTPRFSIRRSECMALVDSLFNTHHALSLDQENLEFNECTPHATRLGDSGSPIFDREGNWVATLKGTLQISESLELQIATTTKAILGLAAFPAEFDGFKTQAGDAMIEFKLMPAPPETKSFATTVRTLNAIVESRGLPPQVVRALAQLRPAFGFEDSVVWGFDTVCDTPNGVHLTEASDTCPSEHVRLMPQPLCIKDYDLAIQEFANRSVKRKEPDRSSPWNTIELPLEWPVFGFTIDPRGVLQWEPNSPTLNPVTLKWDGFVDESVRLFMGFTLTAFSRHNPNLELNKTLGASLPLCDDRVRPSKTPQTP